MQLFVKGIDGASHYVNADPFDSLESLKSKVAQCLDIEGCNFQINTGVHFLYGDDLPLVSFGLEEEQTLFLNFELLGGAKKRKKKTYSKPKKIKHKKKKNKLAVLKYYKVDANNKVSRLRRECPSQSCGAGVFMANHKDRSYCGRCSTSYMIASPSDE